MNSQNHWASLKGVGLSSYSSDGKVSVSCSSDMCMQGSMLLVGYSNGEVIFWELRRAAWEVVKTVKGRGPRQQPQLEC